MVLRSLSFRNLRTGLTIYEEENRMSHFRVTESKEFMEFFDPKLNPGIDISKLYSDSATRINYLREDGKIMSIHIRSLFQRTDITKGYMTGQLAKDVPGFMELFDSGLNPGIDPETLVITDKVRIKYKDGAGRIREANLYSVIVNLRNHARGKYKPYKGSDDQIGCDPKFWSYCTVETGSAEYERITHLSKKSTLRLPMICKKGHPFMAAPYQIFHHQEPCPYCRGRKIKAGLSDAASADPEIKEFFNEPDIDITTVSPISHQSYAFKCPYCGHEFSRYMNQIIYRHPKCPVCHDTGRYDESGNLFDLKNAPYDKRWFLTADKLELVQPEERGDTIEESQAL